MFRYRYLTTISVMLFAVMVLSAAEGDAQGNTLQVGGMNIDLGALQREFLNGGNLQNLGGGGMSGLIRLAQEEAKARYPEDYAEFERLQSTDRRAAMEKLREIASKAGFELPMGGGRGDFRRRTEDNNLELSAEWQSVFDQLRAKFPSELSEIEKLFESNYEEAMKRLRELANKAEIELPETPLRIAKKRPISIRNGNRLYIWRANKILAKRYPEEYAELEKLRLEDEDIARDKLRSMIKEAGITLEQLRVSVPGEDAGLTMIKQDDSVVNSTSVNTSWRSSGNARGNGRGNGRGNRGGGDWNSSGRGGMGGGHGGMGGFGGMGGGPGGMGGGGMPPFGM